MRAGTYGPALARLAPDVAEGRAKRDAVLRALDAEHRVNRVYDTILTRPVRRDLPGHPVNAEWTNPLLTVRANRGLAVLARECVDLAIAGAPEAALRLLPAELHAVVDDLCVGQGRRCMKELDLLDKEQAWREDRLQSLRLINGGASPFDKDLEADECYRLAALLWERGRVLRAEAREQRAAGQLARERVGLATAGGR